MSMTSDAMVERRYLRRRVTFWRVVAGLFAIIAIFIGASRLAG
ncbi:MAG: signal peptide peptidase SppA, partial [Xanthobacteraceae bacterium]|nr:signal peptide peptidase SppA [Xanthobacteraceae bacterium]